MVLLDGARYKSVKKLGFFQELIKKGTLFSNMITYSAHTTTAVHALLTGINGNLNGADNFFGSLKFKKNECRTLPQYLKKEDFNNYADALQDIILPKQGFDEITIHDEYKDNITVKHKNLILEKSKLRDNGKNFFLFLQYSPIHSHMIKNVIKKYKYDDFNEEYFSNQEKNLQNYEKEVGKSENYLKEIFEIAEELDLFKDTLFIVFSDHGVSTGERKGELGYGRYCYDYTLKSFVVFIQSDIFPVIEIKKLCGIIDIMPTILDLFDIPEEANFIKMQGKSLFPLMKDESDERIAYSEGIGVEREPSNTPPKIKSVRTKDWKFIYNIETKEKELYYLTEDPDENNNLINKEPKKAEELFEKLKEFDSNLKIDFQKTV